MIDLTEIQERLYLTIKKYIEEYGYSPTVREYVKTKNYCSDIFTKDFAIFDKQELLEILDKVDKGE